MLEELEELVREVGLEPTSPKAPDPKSHLDQSGTTATAAQAESTAVEQQPATPDAAESTTDSATSEDGGSEDEPPSLSQTLPPKARPIAPVRILARTPEQACGNCGQRVYWSVEEFSGLGILVSIDGPGAIAPTRYHEGVGIPHACPARGAVTRAREVELL